MTQGSVLYRAAQLLGRGVGALLGPVEVEGTPNIPREGGFILLANHQSLLDPVLLQAVLPRPLHTLTKSTQFAAPGMGWLLPALHAIPVRRYRVDAQAVRTLLRILREGGGVGIYPEGERSWDGRLQPLRRGTVRVVLAAGVPVIPCGIEGSWALWPRWSARPRRHRVRIRIGAPLDLGPPAGRREREERVGPVSGLLTARLRELSGEPPGREAGDDRDHDPSPDPFPPP